MILAIDPGNVQSGYVLVEFRRHDAGSINIKQHGVINNDDLLEMCASMPGVDFLCCEGIASYGMAVGKEVFDTCVWIGRFGQAFGWYYTRLIYRKDVKLHLCGSPRAKDANIRLAILDMFGGKELAIGRKTNPGPLYGIKSHVWSALAVAIVAHEKSEV